MFCLKLHKISKFAQKTIFDNNSTLLLGCDNSHWGINLIKYILLDIASYVQISKKLISANIPSLPHQKWGSQFPTNSWNYVKGLYLHVKLILAPHPVRGYQFNKIFLLEGWWQNSFSVKVWTFHVFSSRRI